MNGNGDEPVEPKNTPIDRHRRDDDTPTSFVRGATVRDILRVHQLIRHFGWKRLLINDQRSA